VTQTHARHILLRLNPKQTEAAAMEKLAEFKKRIQAGQADFAALARETARTDQPRKAATWVGPAPACLCPSSRKS
jgi:peptidyl-prolyl cis-trans isomerase SurA